MAAEAFEQKARRTYLEAPDPLASVPARSLSAQGFAERVLRMIVRREHDGTSPERTLELIRQRCEYLVWGEE